MCVCERERESGAHVVLQMNGQDFRLDSDQRGFNVGSGIRRFSRIWLVCFSVTHLHIHNYFLFPDLCTTS